MFSQKILEMQNRFSLMQLTKSFTSSNCGEINKKEDTCGQTSNLGQMINTSSGGGLNLTVVMTSSLKISCTGMLKIRIH